MACAGSPNASAPATPAPAAPDRSSVVPGPPASLEISPRAARVYREAYVIDMHDDMPSKILDEQYDPDVRHPAGFGAGEGNTDLPRLLESGVTAEFLSAFVDARYAQKRPDESYARVLLYLDTIAAFARRHPDNLILATRAADVRRAKASGKVAVFIGVEGGHSIENSLDKLRDIYRRGARYMTLTWNNGNDWAGSSMGQGNTSRGGLTPFGRDVVREMNRLGMLVDLSHVSDSTFFDALEVSTAPVIASHSSARAINDHPRNLSDEQLRAVARNGGVVNVNFFSRFLDPAFAEGRETPLSVLIDHIDHIAKVAGVDHVGLGSDFDGVSALPAGMEDITRLPRIAQALLDRGYSDEDVRKILGGNMLRVMDQVLR
ncbi:MAG: membrane dipeptidase [Gemmatimonadaceae bacterium]|nr:membrane dipeptidase [Gemmatimonadaceae bacterium]NUR20356.1 membrane dipeptidase [Gemmatimonadaceae bacterium]NUS97409.1 membrane dipeptidase [Gemmatimonadaceae bacterium]